MIVGTVQLCQIRKVCNACKIRTICIGYTDLRYCISFCLTEFAIFLTCRICCINIVLNILQENLIREIRTIDFNKLGTHRIRLRTRAIFLFFRPRLRRKRAHRQG